jgi:hypothetical protein
MNNENITAIDYPVKDKFWTKERIIEMLLDCAVNGVISSIIAQKKHISLPTMARRLYGSFTKACEAIGCKPASKAKVRYELCIVNGCSLKVRSPRSPYCEMHYGRLRRTGTLETLKDTTKYANCLYCDAISNGRKFCGARCGARYSRGSPKTLLCKVCGIDFRPTERNICCSDKCRAEYSRIYSRGYYAISLSTRPEFKSAVRNAEYKRKALKRSAFIEEVSLEIIYRRDKGICWLCNKKVDLKIEWPNSGFATLDHVVPLVHGGLHSYSNIKLAHLQCNCRKGAKQIKEMASNGTPLPDKGQVNLF